MRPIIARVAKRSSRAQPQARIGPRARPHARGGRIQRSIVTWMARRFIPLNRAASSWRSQLRVITPRGSAAMRNFDRVMTASGQNRSLR